MTWHHEERPIARDPYQPLIFSYSMGTRGKIRVHWIVLITIIDRESYNGRDSTDEKCMDFENDHRCSRDEFSLIDRQNLTFDHPVDVETSVEVIRSERFKDRRE